MCHSYDRLIDLAIQTDSKLIVHDPIEGKDVVILSIDEFERLNHEKIYGHCECNHHDDYEEWEDKDFDINNYNHRDVRGMSERELLDQINRDIAKWRADKEMEERWERENIIKDEFDDEGPFDPFAEQDYHPADWHSASDVLEDRYKPENKKIETEFNFDFDDEDEDDFIAPNFNEIRVEDIPDFGINNEQEKKNIPFKKEESTNSWLEEPLEEEEEDEPLFYEEPV